MLDLQFAARAAYWSAVAADAALVSARADERRALRLLEDARALREAGMAVKADELAAEARAAAARVDVIRAETEARDTLARLRSLLGIAYGAGARARRHRNRRPSHRRPPASPLLQPRRVAGRPELATLDARIAALEARTRAIAAGRRPAVAVAGRVGPGASQPPLPAARGHLERLLERWSDGQLDALRRAADPVASGRRPGRGGRARADRDELERQVKLDVETSRLTLVAALDAVVAADASRSAARAREEAARERYQAGLAQIWEMLDAQADLADAERSQVRTRATAWIAAAALDRAVGR